MGRRDRLQCEEEERFARIEERKGLFARIHALPKFEVPDSFPGSAELVREDRDGRPSDAMLGIGATLLTADQGLVRLCEGAGVNCVCEIEF